MNFLLFASMWNWRVTWCFQLTSVEVCHLCRICFELLLLWELFVGEHYIVGVIATYLPATNVYVLHFDTKYMSNLVMLTGSKMEPRRGELHQQTFKLLLIMPAWIMWCYVNYVKLHMKANSWFEELWKPICFKTQFYLTRRRHSLNFCFIWFGKRGRNHLIQI